MIKWLKDIGLQIVNVIIFGTVGVMFTLFLFLVGYYIPLKIAFELFNL